jgi:hypothetical protein
MNELVSMSINLHIFFVFLTLLFAIINLFVVKSCSEYIAMTKKHELFTPLYYLSLSVVIFTGSVVLAVFKFDINHAVYLMILTSVIIIIGAFKNHRLFKLTRVRDENSQIIFRKFAAKKYIVDIVLIIITITLAFIFA